MIIGDDRGGHVQDVLADGAGPADGGRDADAAEVSLVRLDDGLQQG